METEEQKTRSRDVTIAVLLGLAAFLIYNANLRAIPAADTYAARYLPFSILQHRSIVLDPIASIVEQGRQAPTSQRPADTAFWMRAGRGDHLVSLYPVVVPVVIAPLYLPAIAYLKWRGFDPLRFDEVARIMEKLVASLLAAASVMLLYRLLRRRAAPPIAALLTLAYALGTTTWVISSQALWTHGLAQLLIIGTLLLITGPCTPFRAAAAGFLCALIACNRQADAILAAGLGSYGLWWAGRRTPLLLVAGVPPVAAVLVYNLGLVGHIAGAYALIPEPNFFKHDAFEGIAGLLFSPTRGLFAFSPFLLFVPLCMPLVLRDRAARPLTVLLCIAIVAQLILYGISDWRQGISFGPRWQTDMVPILVWMLPPVVAGLPTVGRAAFGLACAFSVAVEVIGAFWYIGVADPTIMAGGWPAKTRAAWDYRNAPFIAELKHRRAPADLGVDLRGSIDIATVSDAVSGAAGWHGEVHGWALTNSRTPADVAVLIDGRMTAGTSTFFERIDVARTLGEASPSGWKIMFPADKLASGEHRVSVLVRANAGGEPRLLGARKLTVPTEAERRDQELATAARHAAKVLAERQQGPGYWLTAFTGKPAFERPGREMNTFLNAVLSDIAGPVAEMAGIDGPLRRARDFLRNQIEEGGLVRYHGRPDAPTIGTLGCAITPDADDTALVWRIAPDSRTELLPMVIQTLKQFRTPDGLYRTWLAPREHYQCIDPGKDPNPADIAIQIHVLMWLSRADPPAARALCDALRKRLDDEALWVFYKMAPPLLILRLGDLGKAGCPLQLPASRLQTSVGGQDIWIEALELLRRVENGDDAAGATALLRKLAAEDFALLARAPPLLYHNDLSASVRRFYWSEELGYALWLRLYYENERAAKR